MRRSPRIRPLRVLVLAALSLLAEGACVETRGTAWMAQPISGEDGFATPAIEPAPRPPAADPPARPAASSSAAAAPGPEAPGAARGRVLGVFRNTYYNFPAEADHDGAPVKVMNAACGPIADVNRGFFESLCVQGSGRLRDGRTVSFAKRDCECAEVCPRTGQKICFEALDPGRFPWGRGATGQPITPLLSVAVDTTLIPLGTRLYIPEYDGMPREEGGPPAHDGCFVAEDRGTRVQGEHVDIFTGLARTTALYNRLVPSNQGVTVIVGDPRCEPGAR